MRGSKEEGGEVQTGESSRLRLGSGRHGIGVGRCAEGARESDLGVYAAAGKSDKGKEEMKRVGGGEWVEAEQQEESSEGVSERLIEPAAAAAAVVGAEKQQPQHEQTLSLSLSVSVLQQRPIATRLVSARC